VNVEQSDPSVHHAVSAVLVRYASGIDRREWDLFRSCFTPDCTIDYGEIGAWSGADEITAFMVAVHEQCGFTLHRISNVAVERLPDGVQARSYVDAVIMGSDNRNGVRATVSTTIGSSFRIATDGRSHDGCSRRCTSARLVRQPCADGRQGSCANPAAGTASGSGGGPGAHPGHFSRKKGLALSP
jgi:hypothetical protein